MWSPDILTLAQEVARVAEVFESLEPGSLEQEEDVGKLSDAAVQAVLTLGVKLYSAKLEQGDWLPPFAARDAITATEALATVTEILNAVDVEVFELGLWKMWGGIQGGR